MTKKQKLGIKVLMGVLGALLLLMPFAGCAGEVEKEPIVFADSGWDSAQVHNRIAAFILEHGYGYQSDFIPGDTSAHFIGLMRGDIDVQMETWVENVQEAYDKAIASGDVVDVGNNFVDNWQGWLVPTYIIKGDPERGIEPMAPDLRSVLDMPKYWELFKDPEEPTKGRFHNCIPGWLATKQNTERFEAYGLDKYYTNFITGSDAALSGSMVAAYEKGKPWFGYYWEPTWVLGKLDMTRLEEPPFDKEIWETTRGCAFPVVRVSIVVNASLLDRAPEVVEFLRDYETTSDMMNKVLAYMQETKSDATAAAIWFLQQYESVWTEWVPSDVASKVKVALP